MLYVGLALTSRGPRVIEFNARFGDPETQVVAGPARRPPSARLLLAAATGGLAEVGPLRWSTQHAVTVVVASHNYPGTPRTGDPITGIEDAAEVPDGLRPARRHRPRRRRHPRLGRRSGAVRRGPRGEPRPGARARLRGGVLIELDGSHHRTDIALAAERDELHVG